MSEALSIALLATEETTGDSGPRFFVDFGYPLIIGAVLFFLGWFLGPYTRLREAEYLTERHNLRRLQKRADEAMKTIADTQFDAFQRNSARTVAAAMSPFRALLEELRYDLDERDLAAAENFLEHLKQLWEARTLDEYNERQPEFHDTYLVLRYPKKHRKERNRLAKSRRPDITRREFLKHE